MVILEDIGKRYGDFEIEDFNLKIEEGEIVTLLGESGCGKTTLLNIISGIVDDYRGKVCMNGEDIRGISPKKKGLSMVFQDSLLLPNLNVEDNIAFGLKMKGTPKKERREAACDILRELGLEGYEKRHPYDLSGGQKQRVSLGRALVMRPKLLLMDEPFSALDEITRERLQKLLKSIQKKHGSTVLFVTHDREEAFYLSDKIAVMDSGRLLQFDTPKNLYENPEYKLVARFMGISNIFEGEVKGGFFCSKKMKFPVDIGESKKVCIAVRSEDLTIGLGCDKDEGYEVLSGKINDYSFRAGFYHFSIGVSGESVEVIQNRVEFPLDIGMDVYVKYQKNRLIQIKNF